MPLPNFLPVVAEGSDAISGGCAYELVDHVVRSQVGIVVAARQAQELLIEPELGRPTDLLEGELDAVRIPSWRHPS